MTTPLVREGVMKTEAIKAYLQQFAPSDLANLYNANMEVQVTVAKDSGERVEGDFKGRHWHGYTNGIQIWKPIRIPRNANTEPVYEDTLMTYDLLEHAEGIGMTGWDWHNRVSRWVAYDFDAVIGHSDKHSKKLTDVELNDIKAALANIPYVMIRKSTGGKGLHIYVFLEPVITANHNEHAAVARAILSQLSGLAGFDFSSKVDICGGNMWVWHRKMKDSDGLAIIKAHTVCATAPVNWRDYTKVVSGRRQKNLPRFIEDQTSKLGDIESIFEELTGQRLRTQPDPEHKKIMEWLFSNYSSCSWWDAEHHMLVTHTVALKDCHEALNLKGKFETLAKGSEKGYDHNCFSGNTEVLTEDGPKTFHELSGKKIRLLVDTISGPKWIESEIKSFGIQKTYPMYFGDGTKVNTTYNHMWINRKTHERIPTYLIEEGKTELPIVSLSLAEINWEGYAHGFVFGDDWNRDTRGKETCEVALFKRDNDLCQLLCKYGTLGSQFYEGHGYVNVIRQLPNHWKNLPTIPSKSYALGFVLGLASADGFVNSRIQIFQSDYDVIQIVRKLAIYAGLRPFGVRLTNSSGYDNAKQGYALSISTYNLTREHFLRKDHQEMFKRRGTHKCVTVSKIDWTAPTEEEVYCAIVPIWHNFTLGNLVITGNCFAFPISKGAWAIRRYSVGVAEHQFWEQDGAGWTRCFYNRLPDMGGAARIYRGVERSEGGYWFPTADDAQKAAFLLGADLALPAWIMGKPAIFKPHKSGKLLVEIEKDANTPSIDGWLVKGKKIEKLFNIKTNAPNESDSFKIDERLRHIVGEDCMDAGWVIRTTDGDWHGEPFQNVKVYLQGLGYKPGDVATIMGSNIEQCWKLVNRPFQDEYPRDRQWNRNAAQIRFKPSLNRDALNYPNWRKILQHCGTGLDEAVRTHAWCRQNGILTGADWLKCWIASLFQEPTEPLPYVFFYGPQDSGKSIFHEALSTLMTRGVTRADVALTSQSGFNGELESAVLCVVEETNLQKNQTAYNRIKDWVTGRQLPIHRKQRQPYTIQNTTHWVQCANSHLFCPVFPGDTRITMILVDSIEPSKMIPKKQFIPMLESEAHDFMAEILSLELPPSNDRLNIPCIGTEDKALAEYANKTFLELFIEEKCFYAPGHRVKFGDFYGRFQEWLDPQHMHLWSSIRVGREIPPRHPKARTSSNEMWIGNISFDEIPKEKFGPRYVVRDGKLVQDELSIVQQTPSNQDEQQQS